MFKGSARYGPGEIDRRTQALGGSTTPSPRTTSPPTASISPPIAGARRWRSSRPDARAAARPGARSTRAAGDPRRDRDVRRRAVGRARARRRRRTLFRGHPYGRPVLGTRRSWRPRGPRRASGLPPPSLPARQRRAGGGRRPRRRRSRRGWRRRSAISAGAAPERRSRAAGAGLPALARLERRQGEVAASAARAARAAPPTSRSTAAAPAGHHSRRRAREPAASRAGRRGAALHRRSPPTLPESQCDASRGRHGADAGGRRRRGRAPLRAELGGARRAPISEQELERARQILVADWVFGHERVPQQGLAAGLALALFDLEPARAPARRRRSRPSRRRSPPSPRAGSTPPRAASSVSPCRSERRGYHALPLVQRFRPHPWHGVSPAERMRPAV